ncbi:DUF3263 domain-containing protein [Corynebacterium choanae]|uniref:DUF3263 domain-containing protein n=1 Tax=Corynebacterium choanae TaxID=1862358 RepID=A0A3G6J6Z8_9CORY|nr:DUF3263 domain-containing protein [Corynebacterium choanae]AZA12698.1 hypothetical protein CCHOA_01350 [Corynebacterium choanae]
MVNEQQPAPVPAAEPTLPFGESSARTIASPEVDSASDFPVPDSGESAPGSDDDRRQAVSLAAPAADDHHAPGEARPDDVATHHGQAATAENPADVEEAAGDSVEDTGAAPALTPEETMLLQLAKQLETLPAGARDEMIVRRTGRSSWRFYQQLYRMIDRPEVIEFDPLFIGRLRRRVERGTTLV